MTLSGFLVVNKCAGMTSHSVVNRVRRLIGQKKAGHTGTLDPFATGVLPVALGDATKTIQFLDESRKEYRAVMRLGLSTDTQDCEGRILQQREWQHLAHDQIFRVAEQFTGELQQIPPMYSAIKQNGVPLYQIARKGEEVTRAVRIIFIASLVIEKIELPQVTFCVNCSKGTYVRTLANDIGEILGCGAHLVSLARTASGPFTLDSGVNLEQLEEIVRTDTLDEYIVSARELLAHIDTIELDDAAARRIAHGVAPGPGNVLFGKWPERGARVLLERDGSLLAVAEGNSLESVRLLRVFV
ncbi:tRNA pseudouridine synthase B [Geobacter sp. OR-1]|uniref:tRNA pseudouridine(55) synthase TruB n=1 Tax=Geobacter sp. OR-1 TaxID=1266765 RepID=UPI000543DA33|nr:tRNA pseudouridine(55) synthase TruB [Geobacter sp. OR-1]GAM09979.1 tRNA pseudouridine synthase B [Geobacter sp. OR-1]